MFLRQYRFLCRSICMVLTERKLLANRQNSKKALGMCTGPKRFEKTKYNALKHGLAALRPAMLPCEDVEEYSRLCECVSTLLSQTKGIDKAKADKVALCLWKMRRAAIVERKFIESHTTPDGTDWRGLLKADFLRKICRYERLVTNFLHKLIKELGCCD